MTILAKRTTPPTRAEVDKKSPSKAYQAVAEAVGTLRQYQDVPLRFQRRWISIFLTLMVLIGIIGGLYLNIVSRTAIAGREIQNLENDIVVHQQQNADLQTNIASLLSNEALQARAQAAGYEPIKLEDVDYIVVPGYFPQTAPIISSQPTETPDISASPDFNESLSSWISKELDAASLPLAQEH